MSTQKNAEGQENAKKCLLKYRLKKLIMPYLIATIFLIPLVFIDQCDVPIIIELTAHRVDFDFVRSGESEESEGRSFFSALPVDEARFVHFEKFLIPFAEAEIRSGLDKDFKPLVLGKTDGERILTVTPAGAYASIIFEKIRLNELYLRKGARVKLAVPEGEQRTVLIDVKGSPTEGRINIPESLRIECQNCRFDGVDDQSENKLKYLRITSPRSPQGIDFKSNKSSLLISFELPKKIKLFEEDIYIEKVSFLEGRGNLKTSLAKKGEIILKDLNKKVEIRRDDFIKIDKSKNLRITRMAFQNDGIKLTLRGKVSELKTGPSNTKEALSSQLPSILEWIYNRQPLVLYLSALVLVATTINGILQGLRITPKEE